MTNVFSIDDFLAQNEKRDLLRFSTAGSIDDGKSTLIGRLLHDSKGVFEDQLASVKQASQKINEHAEIDFALITDGLKAEREQGITIDVAYRYFSTPKRKFIIADTPGHEQYTRNMATGASTADLAVILIDARNGIMPQTKRHSFISSLLGVPHMLVAINKMDLVDYSEDAYNKIKDEYSRFAQKLNITDVRFIPISALEGDNVTERSERMSWYGGESFLEILENIYVASDKNLVDLRFPVQYVSRPNQNFRGYSAQLVSGIVRKDDTVAVLPSMKQSKVKSIVCWDGELDEAYPPMSVTLTLEDEIDISRGDMLIHPNNRPHVERHFEGMLVWMGDESLDPSKTYYIKHTTQSVKARIDDVRYKIDVNELNRVSTDRLHLNEIGRVVFTTMKPLFFDPYKKNRLTGSFIVVDAITNNTVAAGMILDREPSKSLPSSIHGASLSDDKNLTKTNSLISSSERVEKYGHKPHTVWITGLVSSGKTSVAYELEKKMFSQGAKCVVLDGENTRLGLSRELDFTALDRSEHLRRVTEVAKLLNQSGIIAICAFVSPDEKVREEIRGEIGSDNFTEVFLDASIDWCKEHDNHGLYAKAENGEIDTLAGVNVPYEKPENSQIRIDVSASKPEESAEEIVSYLKRSGVIV